MPSNGQGMLSFMTTGYVGVDKLSGYRFLHAGVWVLPVLELQALLRG